MKKNILYLVISDTGFYKLNTYSVAKQTSSGKNLDNYHRSLLCVLYPECKYMCLSCGRQNEFLVQMLSDDPVTNYLNNFLHAVVDQNIADKESNQA